MRLGQRLTTQGIHGFRRVRAILHATWKFRIVEFAETLVVFCFLSMLALVVVAVMAMASIFRMLPTPHAGLFCVAGA
jgi:hypothetical protein